VLFEQSTIRRVSYVHRELERLGDARREIDELLPLVMLAPAVDLTVVSDIVA
jgi:hypothetical protein